jgi:low temperature requirement protein LtrA
VTSVGSELQHKRVSWAELFFDLVFVFAVTQVSSLLVADHSLAGVGRALIVFIPIYWAWVGTAVQANVHDLTTPIGNLAIFGVGLAGFGMALTVAQAYGDRGIAFGLAYWAARLVLGVPLLLRTSFPLNPFTVSMCGSGPLLVVGGLLGEPAREIIWLAAAALDLSTPTLLRSRLRGMHFDAGHLTERFGLFVLIALGESIVAIGQPVTSGDATGYPGLLAVAASFVVTIGLWWVYFYFANDAMRHALQTADIQVNVTRHVLSYGHLAFIAAVIAVAVGMHETVAAPTETMSWGEAGLLYGGCALFLATFGYTRWMMFRLVSSTRLVAAAVVVALLPLAPHIPALAALVLLAATLVVLNAIEYRRVARTAHQQVVAAGSAEQPVE